MKGRSILKALGLVVAILLMVLACFVGWLMFLEYEDRDLYLTPTRDALAGDDDVDGGR